MVIIIMIGGGGHGLGGFGWGWEEETAGKDEGCDGVNDRMTVEFCLHVECSTIIKWFLENDLVAFTLPLPRLI